MKIEECSFTRVDWADAREDLCRIRTAVFMLEQKVAAADEWDGLDEQAVHFLVHTGSEQPIATARILREVDTKNLRFHIGRVAVLRDFRNHGIGHRLMEEIIAWCHAQDTEAKIYLHAQTSRRNFYKSLGFCPQGNEFMDAGIPHVYMIHASI